MATKPSAAAAAAAAASLPNVVDTIKTVTVKCVWWNTTKSLTIKLIFHKNNNQFFADIEKEDDNDARKYTLCSLLLQLGKVFEIQPPPYNIPSPRISSIFTKLLECWSLHHNNNGNSNNKQKKIEGLGEIQDGDDLLFLFGDYFQKISLPRNKDDSNGDDEKKIEENDSVDLLELLPKKYNLVTVQEVIHHDSTNDQNDNNRRKQDIECIEILSSSSSEVEDVTDMYIKSRPPPEVIEVEDASDDDDDDDGNEWEKDEYGNFRRTAAYFERKRQGNNHVKSSRRGDDGSGHRDNCSASRSKKSSSSSVNGNDDASMFDSDGGSDNYDASNNDKEENNDDDDSSIEDVTDIMRAKKLEEQQKLIEEAELLETDSEDDDEDTMKKKRKRTKNRTTTTTQGGKRRKVQLSPIEVVIDDEDVPDCPGAACEAEEEGGAGLEGNTTDDANNNDVDLSIKQRIIKLLNTGLHNESNEHEAKNAMKLARRLLDRYNLDQAVLLRERGDGSLNAFSTTSDDKDNESSLHGGIVTVHILNRRKTMPLSSMPRWLENLTAPVKANFRVDAFMTFSKARAYRSGKCSVSFFGIKTNAQLAAYAFKTAAERIAFMTASYDPPRSEVARRKQASQTRTARLSYALGIVAGLDRDVQKGLQEEEQKRQEELKRARNAAKKTGEAYQEDEDCSDDNDNESQQQQQQESIPVEEKLQQLETEHEARLALVDCNKKIAEDVLKLQKIKLSSRKKRSSISFNRSSYETGVVHSKEIDLNQKALQQS